MLPGIEILKHNLNFSKLIFYVKVNIIMFIFDLLVRSTTFIITCFAYFLNLVVLYFLRTCPIFVGTALFQFIKKILKHIHLIDESKVIFYP